MPRSATHPNWSLEFLPRAVSVVRFHCQLLERFVLFSNPCEAVPPTAQSKRLTPLVNALVQPANPAVVQSSSVCSPPPPIAKGVLLVAIRSDKPIGSRA